MARDEALLRGKRKMKRESCYLEEQEGKRFLFFLCFVLVLFGIAPKKYQKSLGSSMRSSVQGGRVILTNCRWGESFIVRALGGRDCFVLWYVSWRR
jgi:hypothetical protein